MYTTSGSIVYIILTMYTSLLFLNGENTIYAQDAHFNILTSRDINFNQLNNIGYNITNLASVKGTVYFTGIICPPPPSQVLRAMAPSQMSRF